MYSRLTMIVIFFFNKNEVAIDNRYVTTSDGYPRWSHIELYLNKNGFAIENNTGIITTRWIHIRHLPVSVITARILAISL